ncbi:BamA/TamA family outer membrane protein [Roseibacterium sp. SDUM158017]|uniref:BamA/TamA family outer membrane protein n=1 Tax=Roseicyclus salinarum TaxID=3036773 RepID=UPI0024155FC9|nr:BamA/TamA family outer membrane protein [Roseibacterium sp. SDUM158017]MDG4650075.1 BamA/TamA family outer membrane protein [Roseibacterium sp. SDUM158017]
MAVPTMPAKRALAATALAALTAPQGATGQTTGELVTGVSYSSIHGGTAFADIVIEDAFNTGLALDFRARGGEGGHAFSFGVGDSVQLGGRVPGDDASLYYRLGVSATDWEADSFASRNASLALGIAAGLSPTLSYRAETFWDGVETDDLDPALSPLLLRDEGRATAYGIGLSLHHDGRRGAGLLAPGIEASAGLRFAASPDTRATTQATLAASGVAPLGAAGGLRLSGSAGLIEGRAEDGWVPIHDRVLLGGPAPRGFAYGGIGPRDAATDDALGGTRFALASAEYLFPLRGNLILGVFADAGSVWSLPGAGGGVVGDDFFMRASYGLSVNWDLDFGTLSVSLADPVRSRSFDEEQTVSLSLEASF